MEQREHLAKLICANMYRDGGLTPGTLVANGEPQRTNHGYVVPREEHQHPLWHEYLEAADAILMRYTLTEITKV